MFPGVAYILMAVEAALLRAGSVDDVAAVELREVSIRESLFVPDTAQGVETIFSLVWPYTGPDSPSGWFSFRFTSHDPEKQVWTEHCVGLIRSQMHKSTTTQSPRTAIGSSPSGHPLDRRRRRAVLAPGRLQGSVRCLFLGRHGLWRAPPKHAAVSALGGPKGVRLPRCVAHDASDGSRPPRHPPMRSRKHPPGTAVPVRQLRREARERAHGCESHSQSMHH